MEPKKYVVFRVVAGVVSYDYLYLLSAKEAVQAAFNIIEAEWFGGRYDAKDEDYSEAFVLKRKAATELRCFNLNDEINVCIIEVKSNTISSLKN